MDEPQIYRCKTCGRRIPKAAAALALSRGKVPAYCAKPRPCRNTGKARIRRANRKAAQSLSGVAAVDP